MVSALGELSRRMSLGSPSVSLIGQGVEARRGSHSRSDGPGVDAHLPVQLLGPCCRLPALCWGPSSPPPAPLGQRRPRAEGRVGAAV